MWQWKIANTNLAHERKLAAQARADARKLAREASVYKQREESYLHMLEYMNVWSGFFQREAKGVP